MWRQPPRLSVERSSTASCLSRPSHPRHHIKQNPRPPPHFLHANSLIVSMLGVPFFICRCIRIESIRNNSQRTVALVLRIAAGDVRHHRRPRKILRRNFADRRIQRIVCSRIIRDAKSRSSGSIVTFGSFTTCRKAARTTFGSPPGKIRTSRFAHASGGITLVCPDRPAWSAKSCRATDSSATRLSPPHPEISCPRSLCDIPVIRRPLRRLVRSHIAQKFLHHRQNTQRRLDRR